MKTKSRGQEPTPPTPGTSHLEPFPPPSHLLPFILNGLSPGCGCHGHCLLAPGSWSGESVTSSPACKDRVWQVVEWPVEARVVGSDQNHPPNPLSQEVAPSKSKSSGGVRASGSGLGSVRGCRARVWSRGQPVSQLCLTGWAAGPALPLSGPPGPWRVFIRHAPAPWPWRWWVPLLGPRGSVEGCPQPFPVVSLTRLQRKHSRQTQACPLHMWGPGPGGPATR